MFNPHEVSIREKSRTSSPTEKTQQTNNYVKLSSLRVNFLKVVRSRKSERKKEQNKFSWAWGVWRMELDVRYPASS